jgi:hypothetical protein
MAAAEVSMVAAVEDTAVRVLGQFAIGSLEQPSTIRRGLFFLGRRLLLLAFLARSRSRGWWHDAAGAQIAHEIAVDLVVVYRDMQERVRHLRRGQDLLIVDSCQYRGAVRERILQCLTHFRLVLQPGDPFGRIRRGSPLQRGAIGVIPFRRVIEPFGERHLAVGQLETVPGVGHGVSRGFQVSANSVEIALGDCRREIILGAQYNRRTTNVEEESRSCTHSA